MKKSIFLAAIIMLAFMFSPLSASAQTASDATWTSSITYFNYGDTPGFLTVNFYQGNQVFSSDEIPISAKGSGEINIGTTLLGSFKGSAVLSASVPIASVHTQFEKNSPLRYARAFYTGFNESDAGTTFYLSTTRANGITETTIGVQNIESEAVTANLKFYSVWTGNLSFQYDVTLAPYAAYVAKLPDIPTYPGGIFDGSMVATAKTVAGDTPARIVASAVETQDTGYGVYSYQGAKEGASTVYLPTAMCNYLGQTSYFAIQNMGSTTAKVEVLYYDKDAILAGKMSATDIGPGAKLSTNPCSNQALVGKLGSAVVKSTNGVELIAMGKIHSSDGLITAFSGLTTGSNQLALPYVNWAANESTDYRTYVAVMNLGGSNATNVIAEYYNPAGTLVKTHTIANASSPLAPFTKANTNPQMAGVLINGSFRGAILIISDQPITAVVRSATRPSNISGIKIFGEDYNGVLINP